MKRKRSRNKLFEKSKCDLWCEWENCSYTIDDLALFLTHIRNHVDFVIQSQSDLDENEMELACAWTGCEDGNYKSYDEFRLHMSYHGFHTKLMSYGLITIKELADYYPGRSLECCMDSNTRNILPELPPVFSCEWDTCYAEFTDAESFYRHVATHAMDDTIIPSLSKEELKRTKFAKCFWEDCDVSFKCKTHLKDHLRTHTQEKSVACPHCGAMFATKLKFKDHILRQTPTDSELNQMTLQLSDGEKEQITFTIQMPETSQNLNGAKSSEELVEQPQLLVNQTNIDETVTISAVSNPGNENEIIIPDQVGEYSVSFTPDIEIFKCTDCDKICLSSTLLYEHRRVHIKNFECKICKKTEHSLSALKAHITYRHSDLRPYACQFCESKFKSKSDLRKHINIHNVDYPFICTFCEFKARCCHTISKHIKQVHQSIVTEYVCHECKKKYTRGNNLTRHLISAHDYQLPPGESKFFYLKQNDGTFQLAKPKSSEGV